MCAHSERYRNILAGIFEILTFYGNTAFPLSPVSQLTVFLFMTVIYLPSDDVYCCRVQR